MFGVVFEFEGAHIDEVVDVDLVSIEVGGLRVRALLYDGIGRGAYQTLVHFKLMIVINLY